MNIVIVGAGSIGSYLASLLSQEHQNVVVIDRDARALERIGRCSDIATRLGSGTDGRLLEEVRAFAPDAFIAVSSDDETNLVACALAKQLGYPRTMARIRRHTFLEEQRLDLGAIFGVDHLVGTEVIVAHELFKYIMHPDSLAVEEFAYGMAEMRTLLVPDQFRHGDRRLAEMEWKGLLRVGLIKRQRKGGEELLFPKGEEYLESGDEVTLIGTKEAMRQLPLLFDLPKRLVHTVVLVGGSGAAIHLAQLLLEQKIRVKIIESDADLCADLARLLPDAVVLHHEGIDLDFLREEKVDCADAFVACTLSHETNVLTAMLAKQAGCEEVLALVSDESMIPLLDQLHISYTLSEKASIAKKIRALLYGGERHSFASLYEDRAQIMEIKVREGAKVLHTPLSELAPLFSDQFLIAMVEQGGEMALPAEDDVLLPGSSAIVVCGPENRAKLHKFF